LPETEVDFFDPKLFYVKQLIYIGLSLPLIFIVLTADGKFYEKFANIIYIIALLLIAGLFVFGKSVKGQANWYSFGAFSVQPAEFAKAATALALSKYLSDVQVNLEKVNRQIQVLIILFLPVLLILPHDPGSALVYFVLFLVLYREGLPSWYLWTGFVAIILFILGLLLDPQYVILIALLVTVLVYFRTRLVDRNWIYSSIIMLLISGFTMFFNNTIATDLIFCWGNKSI
jgi:rod shape determining protein RodA